MRRQWSVVGGQWTVTALVALGLAGSGVGQMEGPVRPKANVLYAAEAQTVVAGKSAVLEVRFRVMDGFHVNSHRPKSELLIPTALKLDAAEGVKVGELEYPAGQAYSLKFDPAEKLDVYMGTFTVKVPVVATPGEHLVNGSLRYQACDAAECYQPTTVAVQVLFRAK